MKRFCIWLKTEYKRAVFLLPSLLKRAVLVLLGIGLLLFCAQKWMETENGGSMIQVGYTADDNPLTDLAVSYVENMESVRSFCRLLPVTEEAGKEKLRQGELTALIVLPEHAVEGILDGENIPGRLYLSEQAKPLGVLFEELAEAGVGLLQTAQAEIYASDSLTEKFGEGREALAGMYREIDAFNLNLVMNREEYFRRRSLSPTGNQSLAVYYGSALLTLWLLGSGLFFGAYLKRDIREQTMLLFRRRIPLWAQLAGRSLVTVLLLCFMGGLTALLLLLPGIRENLRPIWSLQACGLLLLGLCCGAAFLQLLYLLADSPAAAVLLLGTAVLFMGYVSGCFLPSALLPEVVEKLAFLSPASYLKEVFVLLFTGNLENAGRTAAGLTVFTGLFYLAGCAVSQVQKRRRAGL